jgi:uncharacterized membrane protein
MKNSLSLRKLVLTGILAAMVYVITMFTMIRVPFVMGQEAYFHAGDSMIYLSGMVLGGPVAALVSGLGSFLADLSLGASQYMFATFIIKGLMGWIAGFFLFNARDKLSTWLMAAGLFAAGLWMAFAYYFYEILVLGYPWIANLTSLLANIVQAAIGVIIFLPLSRSAARLKRL